MNRTELRTWSRSPTRNPWWVSVLYSVPVATPYPLPVYPPRTQSTSPRTFSSSGLPLPVFSGPGHVHTKGYSWSVPRCHRDPVVPGHEGEYTTRDPYDTTRHT